MKQLRWQRGLALAALAMAAATCHADEFTDKVLRVIRSQAPELRVTPKSDDELEITDSKTGTKGPNKVYLDNLRTACTTNKDGCDDEVKSFVQRIAAVVLADPSERAFVADKVYAVLRSAGFARRATQNIKEPNKQLITYPLAQSIDVVFVVDSETSVRFINRDDMAGAGLTEATLLDLATRNAARLPAVAHKPIKGMPGLYIMLATDGLGSSRAFDAALWEKLEAATGGPLAVAVPARDWIVFTRADQPEQVAQMRALAGRIFRGEPYAVSDAVLVRNGSGWKVLPAP